MKYLHNYSTTVKLRNGIYEMSIKPDIDEIPDFDDEEINIDKKTPKIDKSSEIDEIPDFDNEENNTDKEKEIEKKLIRSEEGNVLLRMTTRLKKIFKTLNNNERHIKTQ